jgi:leader peptidase (prepilin peptidase)/N-methyltransferase
MTGESAWTQASIGAAIWLVALGAVWLVTAGAGMGFGDVKLAPILGFSLGWFGWEVAVFGLICGWCGAGIFAGFLILRRRVNRSTTIAFGPFLLIGFWLAFALGPVVIRGGLPWLSV